MSVRDRPAPLPLGLGRTLEPLYRAVLRRRNRAFDRGEGISRLTVPVISVGNLSVGGTGKTPTVKRIVRWLLEAEQTPAIAMRGYRAEPGERSDEEQDYASSFAGVPIVAQPDRVAGLRPLLDQRAISCIVLDDGFQHRRIARNLDIVLLDASRNVFRDRCLPAGWLREPTSSLSRAGAIILTHSESTAPDQVQAQIEQARIAARADIAIARARHAWTSIETPDGIQELSTLNQRPVIVACGIGHPRPFVEAAREHGAKLVREFMKPDHHRWTEADLRPLLDEAGEAIVLTTSKDWATMSRVAPPGAPIWRPRLEIAFESGEADLKAAVLTAAASAAGGAEARATIPARG